MIVPFKKHLMKDMFGTCWGLFLVKKLCGKVYVCLCGVRKERNAKYCRLEQPIVASHVGTLGSQSRSKRIQRIVLD